MLGRWWSPPSIQSNTEYPVENKTKPDLAARELCIPLVPVDNLNYNGVFFTKKSPDPKLPGGFRVTRVITVLVEK